MSTINPNRVAHNHSGSHDKIYIATIRVEGRGANTIYAVLGRWGRNGSRLSEQVKVRSRSLSLARTECDNLFADKLKGGYQDIASSVYFGQLRFDHPHVRPYLEPNIESQLPLINVTPPSPAANAAALAEPSVPDVPPTSGFAVCVDATGQPTLSKDLEYKVVPPPKGEQGHPNFLWVLDNLNRPLESALSRFKIGALEEVQA